MNYCDTYINEVGIAPTFFVFKINNNIYIRRERRLSVMEEK
jgi:hypothetical protein